MASSKGEVKNKLNWAKAGLNDAKDHATDVNPNTQSIKHWSELVEKYTAELEAFKTV